MFAYCLNCPTYSSDPTGERVQIWPILFDEHVPGFIHKAVQAHIIATGIFMDELYLSGAGYADIYDPETGEIWEIKHGGSTAAMQNTRINEAMIQIDRYLNNPANIALKQGRAGTFTGAFILNCNKTSYCVTYNTPEPGVILYFVREMKSYEPAASYAYHPVSEKNKRTSALLPAMLAYGAMYALDTIDQRSYGAYRG